MTLEKVYFTSSKVLDIINQNEVNTYLLLYAQLPYLFISNFPTERYTNSRSAPSFMLCGQLRWGGGRVCTRATKQNT